MKVVSFSRSSVRQSGIEGALMAFVPFPFILACMNSGAGTPPLWRIAVATISSMFCLACAFLLYRLPRIGQIFGSLALASSFVVAIPYIASNPFAALLASVAIISAGYAVVDFHISVDYNISSNHVGRNLQCARWSAMTVLALVGLTLIVGHLDHFLAVGALAVSAVTGQILLIRWVWKRPTGSHSASWITFSALVSVTVIASLMIGHTRIAALVASLLTIFILPRSTPFNDRREYWWETILNHPARFLLSTFLVLCILGTFLLILPRTTRQDSIALVDAAFTSVSAVCVTGLIVLDTPEDFTLLGQSFILLLIQLGGLGIMSISTFALHTIGRRISLRQERLLKTMTGTDQKDLIASLFTIVRFTFIAEGLGALVLTGLFYTSDDSLWQAVWRGVFTAISAFCNAGFALQSNSLIPYQGNPLILHTVAILIVFGGMAPATSLVFPKWLAGRPVPIEVRIALITTAILLISGTFFLLAFEWNGVLSDLSVADKIHNSWFQSATLRTAGFNSVDIAGVMSPTFLVMLCFMFIGGSPGGTAGGVKTITIGILAMTFWSNITHRTDVIVYNRRIRSGTINSAITIVASGILVWFVIILMLEVTQQISARNIVFEAISAIGTVGLSIGATQFLDEIGKVIVMIAMFAGRIGPMTMFMLMSQEHSVTVSRCPDAKITLT